MVLPMGTGLTLEPSGNTTQTHPVTLPSDEPQRPRRRAPVRRALGPVAGLWARLVRVLASDPLIVPLARPVSTARSTPQAGNRLQRRGASDPHRHHLSSPTNTLSLTPATSAATQSAS
jgi:hypothetical protein